MSRFPNESKSFQTNPASETQHRQRDSGESSQAIPAQIGNYHILGRLGRGSTEASYAGMDPQVYQLLEKRFRSKRATVLYKAKDARTNRLLALKVIPSYTDYTPEAWTRFEEDTKKTRRLSQQNVGAVYDAGRHESDPYLAMEFLTGTDLARRMRYQSSLRVSEKGQLAKGPMNLRDVIAIVRQVAYGLRAAHRVKLFHGDLKPTNIWITPTGQVKIFDFGLAMLSKFGSTSQNLTDDVLRKNDLFSLGSIFYSLLTGVAPFVDAVGSVFNRLDLPETLPPVTALAHVRRDVSPEIEECIRRLVTAPQTVPFRNVDEFLATLASAISPWEAILDWCQQHLWPIIYVAAGSLVSIALVTSWLSCEPRRKSATHNAPISPTSQNAEPPATTPEDAAAEPPAFLSRSLFTHDGNRVLDGNDTGLICEWDTVAGKETQRWDQHKHPVCAITISSNGRWLASADTAGLICLWDYTSGKLVWSETLTTGEINSLWIAPSGNRILVLVRSDETTSVVEYHP